MKTVIITLMLCIVSITFASEWFVIEPPDISRDGDIILTDNNGHDIHWYFIVPFSDYKPLRVYITLDDSSIPANGWLPLENVERTSSCFAALLMFNLNSKYPKGWYLAGKWVKGQDGLPSIYGLTAMRGTYD